MPDQIAASLESARNIRLIDLGDSTFALAASAVVSGGGMDQIVASLDSARNIRLVDLGDGSFGLAIVVSGGSGAPSGPAGGMLSGTYPDPELASEVTIQGDAANEATGILYVKDSAGNTILTIRKGTGYGNGRVTVNTGGAVNIPGFSLEGLADGVFQQNLFSGGGQYYVYKDSVNGVLDEAINHARTLSVNGAAFTSAGRPSFTLKDTGRAAIDTVELHPGDNANTSKVLAVRRITSTSNAIAGRWNVYFSDSTHATRTSAGSFTLIESASEITPLAYDTQDSASQTGILILHDGTQKRVKVGAADSGGAGQRLLTIDN